MTSELSVVSVMSLVRKSMAELFVKLDSAARSFAIAASSTLLDHYKIKSGRFDFIKELFIF